MAIVSISSRFLGKHLAAASAAVSLVSMPVFAHAQATTSAPALRQVAYSSSSSGLNPFGGQDIDGRSAGSAPDGAIKTIAPQYGGGGGGYHPYNDTGSFSHFAFEAGGGFTAPLGNAKNSGLEFLVGDGQRYGTITWGGNFLVGAGWNFSKRFTLLGEFQYDANKIPGRSLSAVYNTNPAFAQAGIVVLKGSVHTLSVTAEPMYYYLQNDKSKFGAYVIGGGGYYHKSTNFTTPVQSYGGYYYGGGGVVNQTVASFADSAVGGNLGTGVTFKPMGEYSHLKLFAEARYVFVDTPSFDPNSLKGTPHTGTEELLPVTFGIRF